MSNNKDLLSKFINYEDQNIDLKRKNGIIVMSPSQTHLVDSVNPVSRYNLKETPIYVKDFYYEMGDESAAIYEIVISKVMNDCNVNSVPYFPILRIRKNGQTNLYSFSQDIFTIKDYLFTTGASPMWREKNLIFDSAFNSSSNDIWHFVKNKKVKHFLLEYMTEECFQQLIDCCLIDELSGQIDRNLSNYFFFKTNDKNKFEGIIAIDSALTWIFDRKGYKAKKPIDFDSNLAYFVCKSYPTKSASGVLSNGSYEQRIKTIKEMFDKGYFR